MRIAHFSDSEPGRIDGVSVSAGLTVDLLRAAGHQVPYFHPGPIRTVPVPGRLIRLAAPWLSIDPGLCCSRRLVLRTARRTRIPGPVDVVHAHTTGPIGMAGFRLARRHGIPLVVTWHTDLVAYGEHFFEVPIGAAYCGHRLRLGWSARETLELARPRTRRARLVDLGRGMMAYAGLVVAPSAKTAAALTEFAPLPPVRILPTPAVLPEPAGGPVGVPAGGPIVLSVGRVTGEKNPGLLLRAFRQLLDRRPDARLVVIGVRQNRRAAHHAVTALGMTGRVHLLPPVPRAALAGWYRAADVLVLASTTDTQSLVVSEAESAGLPVVLADRDLSDGYRLACAPTPEALGDGLHRMLTDPRLRDRVRRAGLAAAAANSPQRYLARLEAAYRDAVSDSAARRLRSGR